MRWLVPFVVALAIAGCLDEVAAGGGSSGRGGRDVAVEQDVAASADSATPTTTADAAEVHDGSAADTGPHASSKDAADGHDASAVDAGERAADASRAADSAEVAVAPDWVGCRLGDEGIVRLTRSVERTHQLDVTPDGDGWLVAWTEKDSRCGSVRLARLDARLAIDGDVRTFDGLCSAGNGQVVATSGRTDLVAVNAYRRNGSDGCFLGVLDREGRALASHHELVDAGKADIAWRGDAFHVVWHRTGSEPRGVKLARLTEEGQPLGETRLLPQATFSLDTRPAPVVATEAGLALAWTGGAVHLLLLDAEGRPRGEPRSALEGQGEGFLEAPALASAEGRLLVAHPVYAAKPNGIVRAVVVEGADGQPLGGPVELADARVEWPWLVSAAATPAGFLVGVRAVVDGQAGFAFWALSRDGEVLGLGPLIAGNVEPGMAVLAPAPDGAVVVFSDCCYEPAGPDPERPNSEVFAARIVCP